MTMLLQFLTLILPRVPQLVPLFRSAFAQVGGDPAEFDAILAANQKLIDKLGDPDRYRNKPGDTTTTTPPPTEFPYGKEFSGFHPLTDDLAHLIKPTDQIWQMKDGGAVWIVTRANDPLPDDVVWELDDIQPPQG